MSLPQFESELRRVARFGSVAPIADPLAAAVQFITTNPARGASRLLGRLLRALSEHAGQFRRAEVCALDAGTLHVAVALMDAAQLGTDDRDWRDAVAAADAANA